MPRVSFIVWLELTPRPQIVSFLPMKSTRIDIRNVVEKLFSACMAHLFFLKKEVLQMQRLSFLRR
ncbi:hypothetical protein AL497_03600 [Klebsiella aerogenes]|nr:hypothetical protein AL497_03600 [Klebsiella aerogenes]KZQ52862.1 hypothetical protein A3N43_00610 [Klebsiella aerogenes]